MNIEQEQLTFYNIETLKINNTIKLNKFHFSP